ncbi:MAG: DUF2207 domain-containing protein [Bacilli bacterium]|nr:DUF2207 domain-containing protein [Bacilli bacterium]
MKKTLKIFSLIIIVSLFNLVKVKANSINSISMDIYVDNNGTAHVVETWNASLDSGTEGYKPYYNLGNSNITNFTVTKEDKIFTSLDNWDVNASFEEKAYKSGINSISDGVELCFGISEYGNNNYILKYDITNFVARTDDSDIIYWTLIPHELSSKPDKVYIKIYSDESYSDDLPVWGYGKYGAYTYVYDGYIEMSTDSPLDSDEYMTILVNFPINTFNIENNYIGNNFEYYSNMAEEGSTSYTEESDFNFGSFMALIINFIVWVSIITGVIYSASNASGKYGTYHLDFKPTGTKIPKDLDYFRDIPCNKDIYYAYWVAANYNLIRKQTDFLGAVMLKWLKENKITIKKEQSKALIKKEITSIVLQNDINFDIELEKKLYDMMYEASIDGILESKEFEKWCQKNYKKILNWFNEVIDYETDKLVSEGKIRTEQRTKMGIFKTTYYVVDSSMMEIAKQMRGLKKFLNEFSNIKDRETIEVMLWEEYLMYAQIFGIAEKVAKEFKKIYPDVINDVNYNDIIFINHIAYSGMVSASSAKTRAESYSAGGGGFSAGGGGGGSFGGGGGGGGFR